MSNALLAATFRGHRRASRRVARHRSRAAPHSLPALTHQTAPAPHGADALPPAATSDGAPGDRRRGLPRLPAPSRPARLAVAGVVGVLCAVYRWYVGAVRGGSNDFGPVWGGARAMLHGLDPYEVVGPGGPVYEWAWPLAYPFPALLAALPVAALAEQLAAATFTGLSAAAIAYVLTRPQRGERGEWGPLAGVLSASMWGAVQLAQWSPLLSAAAIIPGLGWLLAAKPTIGAALFVAYPRRSTVVAGLLVLAVSLLVLPRWPFDWLENTRTLTHLVAPVTILPFGPLLLLALLKWRRPEARLLAALACVPTTGTVNDTLPLFLIPATAGEAVGLALASHVAQAWIGSDSEYPSFAIWSATSAARLVPLVYLPALVLVLRRPNEGSLPDWGRLGAGRRERDPSP